MTQYNPEVEALQKALRRMGFDPGPVDGKNGPKTRSAAKAFSETNPLPDPISGVPPEGKEPPKTANPEFDPDGKLNGVKNALAQVVLAAAKTSKTPFVVLEGLRSKERQAQLVKSGASKTMNSRHLTGDAVDLWPVDPETGKKLPSDAAFPRGSAQARDADKALWAALRTIAEAMKAAAQDQGVKIEWGGDWKSFPDGPHFQL